MRLNFLVLLTCVTATHGEDSADPKRLDVPAEKTKVAADWIAKLDDDDVAVRDGASDKLKALGRDALPAMLAARKGKPSNEVQNRLEKLLPAARRADFDLRAACFLADKDRKFDHDLLGWTDLKAGAKDTKESRLLFVDILADDECRGMLLLALDPSSHKEFQGRWQAKKDEWWAANGKTIGVRPKPGDPIHWMTAALLADLLHPDDYRNDYRWAVQKGYTETDEGKLAVQGKGRYGEAFRQFARYWIERQTENWGLSAAASLSTLMNFEPAVERGCYERQFELMFKNGSRGNTSFGQLAYTRDPKYVASFRRLFDAGEVMRQESADGKLGEIEVRDAALAMCIALSGQDPVAYGFKCEGVIDAKNDRRYDTYSYWFASGGGKTTDEMRKAAFEKWAEWEKANPDKLKAKPPEKKDK